MRSFWLILPILSGCSFSLDPLGPVDAQAPCTADTDCAAPDPRCDVASGRCVPCLPGGSECAGGHCATTDGGFACASGCVVDGDCKSGGAPACCKGACVDTATDPKNCGGCGTVCNIAHGTAGCAASGCTIVACDQPYADCDKTAADGCEADLTSAANCGKCGVVCPHACGSSLTAPMTMQPTGWTFNGSAAWDGNAKTGVLTPDQLNNAGSIVYQNQIMVDAFDAVFDFKIATKGAFPADGMGFMLETDGPSAVGRVASGLGIAGLHGFGIELDVWNNAICGDSDGNHVALDDLTFCAAQMPTLIGKTAMPAFMLGDGSWHTAAIHFDNGAVKLTLDGATVLDGESLPLFQPAPYYFGFGAGTGGSSARMEIRNVGVVFPSLRCL